MIEEEVKSPLARPEDLRKSVLGGLTWSYGGYAVSTITQVVGLIVLARLLSPEEFGFFAISMIFIGANKAVVDTGLWAALVQKKGSICSYLDVVWTINLLMAVFLVVVLWAITPWVATSIFDAPEAIWPTWIVLLTILVLGLSNPATVIFLRNIDMKRNFLYTVPPQFFRYAGSILFALLYPSIWSLVFGYFLSVVLQVVLSYVVQPYCPRFKLDPLRFKELYAFGGWLQLKNVFRWASRNLDVVVVGSLLGAGPLGFYDRALALSRLPEQQMNAVVNQVAFPMFSAMQDNPEQLRRAMKQTFDLAALTVFPLVAVVILFNEPLVELLLGAQWMPLADAFRLLIIAVACQTLVSSYFPLLRGVGFPKMEFWLYMIKLIVAAVLLYPLTKALGIEGAALSILGGVLVASPIMLFQVAKIVRITWQDWLVTLLICSGALLAVWPLVVALQRYIAPHGLGLIVLLLIAGISYLGALILAYYLFGAGPVQTMTKALSHFGVRWFANSA